VAVAFPGRKSNHAPANESPQTHVSQRAQILQAVAQEVAPPAAEGAQTASKRTGQLGKPFPSVAESNSSSFHEIENTPFIFKKYSVDPIEFVIFFAKSISDEGGY